MSKKNNTKEENDLREFENEVSKVGQIGSGSRHSSYFIVINEGAMQGCEPKEYFDLLPKLVEDKLNVEFYAYNMETNKAGKYHIHLYLELEGNGVRFKTMQNIFKGAHIELRRGSPKQALTYLEKPEGVLFGGQEKSHTVVIPVVKVGDFAPYELIKYRRKSQTAAMTTQEKFDYFIGNCNSSAEVKYVDLHFATVHQTALQEAFNEKRYNEFIKSDAVKVFQNPTNGMVCYSVNRKVYYIYGPSRTGKTLGVAFKYGDSNVSTLTELKKDMKFDDYRNTLVMILDEFYSQLAMSDTLNILDDKLNYLPSRYMNKRNLTDTIVLTSNDPIDKQYPEELPQRRSAFLNRITAGIWYMYRAAADESEKKLPADLHTGVRYIACEIDGKRRRHTDPDFDPCEPPIYVDNENVKLVSYQEIQKIMAADNAIF